MKKIIFLDIDGTLAGVRDGKQYIPESAIKVIKKSRKNGNMIFYVQVDLKRRSVILWILGLMA